MHIATLIAKLARESYARGGCYSADVTEHTFPTEEAAAEFSALFNDATATGTTVEVDYETGGACVYALAA